MIGSGTAAVAAAVMAAGARAAATGAAAPADRWQYLAVLAACLAVTLPLELLVGARVYRQPRRLARALAPAVAAFVAWDVVAIARGHWWYVDRYLTGWQLPGALPVEELAFFLVVPICALLTYEAVTIVLAAVRPPAARPAAVPAAGRGRVVPDA